MLWGLNKGFIVGNAVEKKKLCEISFFYGNLICEKGLFFYITAVDLANTDICIELFLYCG